MDKRVLGAPCLQSSLYRLTCKMREKMLSALHIYILCIGVKQFMIYMICSFAESSNINLMSISITLLIIQKEYFRYFLIASTDLKHCQAMIYFSTNKVRVYQCKELFQAFIFGCFESAETFGQISLKSGFRCLLDLYI